ncbi:hypothetical protein LMJ38_32350 [Streptomyces sp. R1]|uniref:hypothetical protein n=1 Tax=Streptomyces TaxID=1883 RepID=UPI00099C3175|nr:MULTISPECIES: hypothetical protein [unclassified Streptomyces]MCC8340596.1 hypothetical protein [Streptomyces sp. R1]MDA4892841.1 hypothetical protein [Streptomyces sp. MS2A]MYS53510.1 hypothetical protein [Streptomyces sp. SID6013]
MADDDFYTRDRPADAPLPEDRPRGGGGPEDVAGRGRSRRGKFWLILALIVLVVIFLALFMP